jgi:superfamily II DNA/RNA helicase
MATKFFTNKDDNTLIIKFEGIFTNTQVHYFDALVGFFRASGYFRMRPLLTNTSKIRILVGIDVDYLISEAARKGLEFNFNTEVTREEFLAELKNDIQSASYFRNVEEGILQFVNDIIEKKIDIKAHPSQKLHSKIYIFRPENFNEHHSGSVITGSSNLSESGLERNFEFNVELRDFDDVAYALKTFNELWLEAIDILPSSIAELKTETYLNEDFTPFEVYLKFLIEYFGKSIEYDPESVSDLPKGYKKLHYQIDAVNDGYNKLMQHNGFVLADVVGLGKTIIATIVAKKFYFSNGYRTKILIIHPPALKNNWERTIRDFEVPNVTFITNGSLHKITHPEYYDLIIVDEAHKFRSDESDMFNLLQKICKTPRKNPAPDGSKEKRVILVTATPLNNQPSDIRNQLYLFQDAKTSSLEIGNIQHFFRKLIDDYDKLKKQKDKSIIAKEVKRIYDIIRVKVLEPIIVRRTRTDIRNTEEYWNDIKAQGYTFPDIEPPKQILYQMDEELSDLYDETLNKLKDTKNGLRYFRYQAIKYLPEEIKKKFFNKNADIISDSLAKIMKTLLVKRIDSSFEAFKMSLKRYYDANTAMAKMIENGRIYIAPKLGVSEYILNNDEQALQDILSESDDPNLIQAFSVEEFDKTFIEGIHHDQKVLELLFDKWKEIHQDPKYDELVHRIKTELMNKPINDNGKLIIFSESKETTDYLAKRLKKDNFTRLLSVDSSNQKDLTDIIEANFDANIKLEDQLNDVDIIITTEVLAEGVNLHRSNIILNYDIPWNATRLMQRIGRVNRIGTPSKRIYIYNFFPTSKTDSEIELNKKAYIKLQAFHSALGEDSQIYSNEEEFGTFGLFEKVPEEERDERLVFLNELRRFRDEQPESYKRIRDKIPRRARTGRSDKSRKDTSLVYIKNQKRDSFYYIDNSLKFEELTFIEAARIFKAHITEKPVKLHHSHHDQIGVALQTFREEENLAALGDKGKVKLGPNDQRALDFIHPQINLDFVSNDEKEILNAAKSAIIKGKFQKLPREINKLAKERKAQSDEAKKNPNIKPMSNVDAFQRLIKILKAYPLLDVLREDEQETKPKKIETKYNAPQIIISESFAG